MIQNSARRWAGVGLGALILAGGTFALCSRTLAQGQTKREIRQAGPQDFAQQDPAQFGGGQPGQPGQPGFQGGFPGGPGGPGGFPGMPGMMGGGGGASMAATSTAVYVLRGNQLLAFDATTLKLKAQAEVPMPRMGPMGPDGRGGFGGPGGGPGGFGGAGGGNNFGGGRPEREQR